MTVSAGAQQLRGFFSLLLSESPIIILWIADGIWVSLSFTLLLFRHHFAIDPLDLTRSNGSEISLNKLEDYRFPKTNVITPSYSVFCWKFYSVARPLICHLNMAPTKNNIICSGSSSPSSESTAAVIEVGENIPKSLDRSDASSAQQPDGHEPDAQKTGNDESNLSGSQPDGSTQEGIHGSNSEIERSARDTLDGPLLAPLHVIRAAMPSPPGLETKTGLDNDGWSISSICPSEHADQNVKFNPDVPNQADPVNQDAATREDFHENCEGHTSKRDDDPVEAWLIKYLTSPSLLIPHDDLKDPVNSRCDINPDEGKFLPAIIQPETVQCTVQGPCRDFNDIVWRQINMTAELHIKKEIRSRENIAKTLQMALNNETPGIWRPDSCRSIESETDWPDAKCMVRPAIQSDYPAIAEIINEENRYMLRSEIDESFEMTAEGVAHIWDECCADSRPFIVVTPAEEDFLDRSKWPKHSGKVYDKFAQYIAEQPRPNLPVVGFAFVTNSRLSLDGRPCPLARYSGRLTLIVHPAHRNKLYGSALLDRILLSISSFHKSIVDHEWKLNKNKLQGVYEFPASRNVRQYTHLHVEVIESHDKERTDEPKTHFLRKFDFEEVSRFRDGLVAEDDQRHMHWQDLVTWTRAITPTEKIFGRY